MSRQPPKASGSSDQKDNSRNEYIPSFISSKPFYAADLLADTEYLSHQRSQTANEQASNSIANAKWYSRSKTGPAATKYRKGACENCGAMTHKTKECLSRPRRTGAKWTGRDIQADEVVEDVRLGWDAKRDRWNGYDAREYDAVVRDYEDLEALKKDRASETPANADGSDGEEAKEIDEDMNLLKSQPKSTRQLRLREDTAKYLLDLNLDSAKYDPKTRTMDNTALALNDASASNNTDLASEGFVRPSHDPTSDAAAFERAQRYAWEAQDRTTSTPPTTLTSSTTTAAATGMIRPDSKVHLEANPTASSLAHRKHVEAEAAKKAEKQKYLQSHYGDQAAIAAPKSKVIATSSSAYIEYDPETGRPKDYVKTVARSKYPEDIYPGNHTSVFGSYWREGRWGYQCCHSFVKNSYCTGEEGKRGFAEEEAQRLGRNLITDGGLQEERADEQPSRKRKADDDDVDQKGGGSEEGREKRAKTEDAS
ncbi:mRNA splicing protein [Neophaeococcomyces mojaviensis]|uniref:mRNA splicing protein n=1 Tax=Neophaeococcomyces mojaviensis TaxID=3383035 RepID=A0ACC3AG40_9EURO|nr:mRNA splicing protein [Knufia sp. JES_112]